MDKTYIVYMHTNMINNKKYIGITCRSLDERSGGSGCNYKDSSKFYKDIQAYGWSSFSHDVLLSGLNLEEAKLKEKEMIALYNTTNPEIGYNIHQGGEMPPTMNGVDNPFYGDHRFAGSNHPMYGRKHTEEARKKMSKNHWDVKGEKNPFYNDHRFIGKNNPIAKAVMCLETGIIYDTVTDAERQTGVARQTIAKQIRGKLHHAGGFHWQYADNKHSEQKPNDYPETE